MWGSDNLANSHPPLTLEFSDLKYTVRATPTIQFGGLGNEGRAKHYKTILNDVSGIFKPGELTAIMGPSGAGKSSLLNILTGYKTSNVGGSINVNGKLRDLQKFQKLSCYIMQDDVLLEHLTVNEAMGFAASLKLPLGTTPEQKAKKISEILKTIGLANSAETKTMSLSGGERKRLAIALELINNPPIMFFDEPTSGLDSVTCYSCVKLLKTLANDGRTIIATIHQPSARIFEQFDALYLLADGYCLYRGPVRNFVPYAARQGIKCPSYHNPADFAIEIASGDYGMEWVSKLSKAVALASDSDSASSGLDEDLTSTASGIVDEQFPLSNTPTQFQDKVDGTTVVTLIQDYGSRSSIQQTDGKFALFWNQFTVLLHRSFLCVSRNLMLTHLRFASTILVALLIGNIYHNAGNDANETFNNLGNLFFGLLFLVFSSMMTTVLTFPLERVVLIREHFNSWYSLGAYYMARTLADLPFQLFFPFLYILLTYFMTDQPYELFRFLLCVLSATLISLVAQSFALLIGAGCDIQSAVFIAPVSAIPFFLFTGFFMNINAAPAYLRWISWISYAKYAFQTTLTAVYGFERGELKCSEAYCHFKNPRKFLEQVDCVDIPVVQQSIILFGILLAFRIAGYVALKVKIRVERY